MEGNWNGALGQNKYQYNGKEWNDDFGLGWNDYGARFYDPAMSRWVAVDPLAEKYVRHNPYSYVLGNPVKFIDPDGMQVINGDEQTRDEAKDKLENKQKSFESKHAGNKEKKREDFSNRKEYREYKKERRELRRAEKEYAQAEQNYQHTEQMIQNFAKVDKENFAKVDNLTYIDKSGEKRSVDVKVTSGDTGDHGGGMTSFVVDSKTGTIFGNVINITIANSLSIKSNVLAHEFGHSYSIASNPVGYKAAISSSPNHNCQDPSNRNTFISKTAVDWQDRFDTLK